MASLSPREQAVRDRIEALVRLMEPGLDLLLAIGDRVSRLVERNDDWEPPRPASPPVTGRGRL
ncbi:MAG TPA: hypothetical protein VKA96_09995 [Solirubrobacteraceae bacterium]|jgi:hypothetical protein|nr:hypothetical protein [Solirubrobacteraceae bacterium]